MPSSRPAPASARPRPAPTDTTSAALLVTLPPDLYSVLAHDRSLHGGIVLLEIYDAE